MEKKCTICGKKYNAKQERSIYCSNKCKQHAHRNKITETVTVTLKENKELRNALSDAEIEAAALLKELEKLDFSEVKPLQEENETLRKTLATLEEVLKFKEEYPVELCGRDIRGLTKAQVMKIINEFRLRRSAT